MSPCRIYDVICNNRIYRDVESVLHCYQWVMYIIMVLIFFGVYVYVLVSFYSCYIFK